MIIINLAILLIINLVNCTTYINNKNDDYLDFIQKPTTILISAYFGTKSHIKFMLEINQNLQTLGNKIYFATSQDNLNWANGYNITKLNMGKFNKSNFVNDKEGLAGTLPAMYNQFYPKYKGIINELKPDLVICDFFSAGCIDYCQESNIPLIIGLQALDSRLTPTPYINDNVDLYIPVTTEHMGFWSRWYNTFIRRDSGYKTREEIKAELNKVRAKYGIPPRNSRWGDFDKTYKLLNTYFGFEIPRPLHPTFELIGPIRSFNIVPLTDDLSKFLDIHNSVLFAAFGSRVKLSHRDLNLIVQAGFLALNQGIINGVILATITPKELFPNQFETVIGTVKSEDLLNGKYPEFKVEGFAPQESILKHKSTKLFLSHGGLESIFETIFTLTPVLVMPFYGDQPINAQLIRESNLGGIIDKDSISSNDVFNEIKRIVIDESGSINRNLKRVKTLSYYKSIGIKQVGEKILTFSKVAKSCRIEQDSKNDELPCELKHMITVDQKTSRFKAYQWDIYIFNYILATLTIGVLIHYWIKYYFEFNSKGYTDISDISSNSRSIN